MGQSSHPYHGLYINLDRSPERRRNIEEQLDAYGLRDIYGRFPAIDGKAKAFPQSPLKPGEIGVFLSHRHALEQARVRAECVHILEDDALLTPHVPGVIGDAIRGNLFDRYDFLFTDILVICETELLKKLRKGYDGVKIPTSGKLRLSDLKLLDLARVPFASTQSYVVGAKSLEKVLALYDEEIANGLKKPVDIFIRQQVRRGTLRAACVFPFITTGRFEDVVKSTIAGQGVREGRSSALALAVLRYLFFVGCDLDYAQRVLNTVTQEARKPTDHRHALLMQITEFVMSPDFEDF